MTEAGRLDIKISLPGDEERPRRPGRLLTLNQVLSWIKLQELDDYTYNGLEKIISKYPTHALPSIKKNFNTLVNRVRAERRKESRSEN